MELQEALQVLAANRGNNVVITTMAAIGEWFRLSDTPLDFAFMPSSMGQGPGIGLGIALAQNRHGVIVVNGDGSMLMNLGSLVTLAGYPANVYLVIMDNQMYEITGGQPTVGAGKVDFAALARGAGIQRIYHFEKLDASEGVLSGGGGFRYELARKYGIHMGVDVAHSRDTTAFYVQVGSAWMRP